jgi:uroporphyrinogen III methyltransferase/synthase
LEAADVILYDALVDTEILSGLRGDTIFVGKRCGNHSLSQKQIIELMVSLARSGKRVVRLKGGDPTVLGRGGEELLALARSGIAFETVPGVTSAVAAPLLAGIPVTHRGLADSFAVITAHRCGEEENFSIPPFNPRTTLIVLMGVGTVDQWRDQLHAEGYPSDLPVAFVTDASTGAQQVLVTTLEWAAEDAKFHAVRPPTTVVVGAVVSLRAVTASPVPEARTAALALEQMLDGSAAANSFLQNSLDRCQQVE